MRLITSILVSSILLISLAGKFQNLGIRQTREDATAFDNSEILMAERGSGRDEQKQAPMLEQDVDA
jgi:hypothetical protein